MKTFYCVLFTLTLCGILFGVIKHADAANLKKWTDHVVVQRIFEQRPADAFQAVTAVVSQQQMGEIEALLFPRATKDTTVLELQDAVKALKLLRRDDLEETITALETKIADVQNKPDATKK
jgi:hypothetical protein